MIIEYEKNQEMLPVLYTLDKGKAFPLVTNKIVEKKFFMEFSEEADKDFFSKLKKNYGTVENFDEQLEILLKTNYTPTSIEDCIEKLDLFSIGILSLFKDFTDSGVV